MDILGEPIESKYLILVVGLVSIAFVLGMFLENKIMLNQYHYQPYNFADGGYTTGSVESYGFFVGDSNEMERLYNDFIVPSLKGEAVCLYNTKPIRGKNESV